MRGLPIRLLLALCLFTSTVQGFVAQTHVHAAAIAAVAAERVRDTVDALPVAEDTCVLCTAAAHTPSVAPPTHAMTPVLPLAGLVPLADTASQGFATLASHHWRGRGPPGI